MGFGDRATEMAREYYSGDTRAKEMEAVELRLAQWGITPEQIRAKAMQLCGVGLHMLDRMGTNCETSLRVLRKDNDRRSAVQNNAHSAGPDEAQKVRKVGVNGH
jgi:hypothetical protein